MTQIDAVEPALYVLRSSANRLRKLVAELSDSDVEGRAYPSEWSIADVMSHLGSGAEISQRRLDDGLAGRAMPDDFAPSVWAKWNAKTPQAKVADGVVADQALVGRFEALSDAEQARFRFAMGPMEFDFAGFVGLRLNEHVMHTWDIEVVGDRGASLPLDAAAIVIDNLGLIARFTAKPSGSDRTIAVATTAPLRRFAIALTPESVTLDSADGATAAELELPAEAFARLVYGRLDPFHTPTFKGDGHVLDELRRVFPGP